MPRSYWLPVIAVVGLALASSVGANPIAAHDHLNGNASQSQQQVAAKYQGVAQPSPPIAETDIERLASALKAANANPYASAEQKRASEYLQTQRDMVKWAGRMFWVGLVEAAITFLGVILVGFTLNHTKRAADAANVSAKHARRSANAAWKSVKVTREIGQKQIRAYLSCEGATFTVQDQWLECHPLIKNYGQSPASKIKLVMSVSLRDIEIRPMVPEKVTILESAEFVGYCAPIPAGCEGRAFLFWQPPTLKFEIKKLANENALIWLTGELSWEDVFETVHHAVVILSPKYDRYSVFGFPILRRGELSAVNRDPMTEEQQSHGKQ